MASTWMPLKNFKHNSWVPTSHPRVTLSILYPMPWEIDEAKKKSKKHILVLERSTSIISPRRIYTFVAVKLQITASGCHYWPRQPCQHGTVMYCLSLFICLCVICTKKFANWSETNRQPACRTTKFYSLGCIRSLFANTQHNINMIRSESYSTWIVQNVEWNYNWWKIEAFATPSGTRIVVSIAEKSTNRGLDREGWISVPHVLAAPDSVFGALETCLQTKNYLWNMPPQHTMFNYILNVHDQITMYIRK